MHNNNKNGSMELDSSCCRPKRMAWLYLFPLPGKWWLSMICQLKKQHRAALSGADRDLFKCELDEAGLDRQWVGESWDLPPVTKSFHKQPNSDPWAFQEIHSAWSLNASSATFSYMILNLFLRSLTQFPHMENWEDYTYLLELPWIKDIVD